MFYLDMGPDGAKIHSTYKIKTVGQYVIYRGMMLPGQLSYKAHTVVTLTANGNMIWYKNKDRHELALLTKEEQGVIMLQILKSEVW
jgi:hypothetical protein